MLVTSWIDYVKIQVSILTLIGILYGDPISMVRYSPTHLFFFATAFALLEKINKQKFVLNHTNECSRKILMSLQDHLEARIVVVSQLGKVMFSNDKYQAFIRGVDASACNIFKLTEGD